MLASQSAVPYVLKTQLEFIDKTYGDPKKYLFAVAGAPYFDVHDENDTTLTAEQVLARLTAHIAENAPNLSEYAHLATYYGLADLAYEGGPDTYGPNNIAAKKAASLDPRMKDVIVSYLNDWYSRGGGLFNWFVAGPTNYDSQYGTWGLTNSLLNLNSPKAQGVAQVGSSVPVAVSVGTAVTGEVLARDYVGSTLTAADGYPRYLKAGDYLDYVIRAPQAGDYDLVVRYAEVSPGGKLDVIVNDVVAQTLSLPVTGSTYDSLWAPDTFADASAVRIKLSAGLNVVRLRVAAEGYTLYSLKFQAPAGTTPPPVVSPANGAPSVTATAAMATVTGKSVGLTAVGTDDGGAANLTYSWSVVGTPPAAVAFSAQTAATTATFTKAGLYTLRVTARDAQGLTGTADVTVTVVQTPTGLSIAPATVGLTTSGTQQFTAAGTDQFGQALTTLPVLTWTATAGTVTSGGLYTAPTTAGTATVTATVGTLKATAAVAVTAPTAAPPVINYGTGFTTSGLQMNGSAGLSGSRLRLAGGTSQAGSAYATTKVDVTSFSTTFRFQMSSKDGSPWSLGDGLTFVLQNGGTTALGTGGSGLGYQGITNSVAVKFDLCDNAGEGVNSTGLYTGGAAPTKSATSLDGTGLDLHSGDVFRVDMTYDGTTLTVKITDENTGKSASQRYTIDLTAALGGSTAYAGFTAGTGALAGNLDILDWSLTNS